MNSPRLSPKQELFCLEYIKTGNASEAYRIAYDAENMKPESINRKAKDVIDNVKIAARIEELRAPVREKAMLTLESHLERLRVLSEKAEEDGKYAAAVTAEVNRGKAAGLYVEKVDVTNSDGSLNAGRALSEFYGQSDVSAKSKP